MANPAPAQRHSPVLRDRVVELLEPALAGPGSVCVDGTLGMGGHAEGILERCPEARVVGIDRDQEALEAIQIATHNGAKFLGEDQKIGTLEVGKQADIVVIKGDPSKDIKDIENVELVFKDGKGYDSRKLIDSVRGLVGLR